MPYLLLAALVCFAQTGGAVLFHSTSNVAFNTTAPGGALEGSGWQFQGQFRNSSNDKYLGTPISAHHFITARHISDYPSVGEPFYFNGETHFTVKKTNLTACDLTIWEVSGTFPYYAPIYSKPVQPGDPLVVFGRGTQRGDPVYANGELKGWKWGAKDFVMRWGENTVAATGTISGAYGAGEPVIQFSFNNTGGANDCMLSEKDSGGAMFIKDTADGKWKLAAINSYVSPVTFSFSPGFETATRFSAALFDYSFSRTDAEKLYTGVNTYLQEKNSLVPASAYSSHVGAHLTEIQSVLGAAYDADADGLPDWWEQAYAGDPVAMVATNNADGDLFTNYEEWLADTVPTNPASYPWVGPYTNAEQVVFGSSSNREYQVEYRLDLSSTGETWQTEIPWFPGLAGQTAINVSSATSNRFYRIRVQLR